MSYLQHKGIVVTAGIHDIPNRIVAESLNKETFYKSDKDTQLLQVVADVVHVDLTQRARCHVEDLSYYFYACNNPQQRRREKERERKGEEGH